MPVTPRTARTLPRLATLAAIAVAAGLVTISPAAADTGSYYSNGNMTPMSTGTLGTGVGAKLTGAQMVARARDWVSHGVTYNEGQSFADGEVGGPYRTDCGGLVDMAWQLTSSPVVTTPSPGLDSATYSTRLSSWSQLQPGDALAVSAAHASLFAGWTNQSTGDFTYIAEDNPGVPTGEHSANIHDLSIDGYSTSSYELLRPNNLAPAIPAGFNVTLWGFNSGQTVSGTLNLTSHPTQSGVIEWLDYVVTGPNGYHTEVRAGGGASNYPYGFNTSSLAAGTYTVTMTANEIDGQNHSYQGGSFTVAAPSTPTPPASSTAPASSPTALLPSGAQQTFVVAPTGHLLTKWQTSAGSAWTGWTDLGGAFQGMPTAVVNAQGEISVFAIGTDGNLYTSWQSSPGGGMSGFASLGGGNLSGTPSVVFGSGGGMAAFAVDASGNLRNAWQTSVGSAWTGWISMGGTFQASPAAVVNSQGEISVFVTGTDGNLYTSWQSSPGGGMSGFASLGGGNLSGTPSVVFGSGGGMAAFAVDASGNLRNAWQTSVGSAWTGWISMGGTFQASPAAVADSQGDISVFVTGTDGNLYTSWQASPGSGMSGFAGLGGAILTGTPNAVVFADGHMDAFAEDGSGNLYTTWQTAPGSAWTGWVAP
ncbi:hypothetical protein [Kitasatospora sp. LaBMicrA B282]|uniref:hypothetical protein n=1 Tax=Kitasatospora sp. LaBMicrA B282 TaxID=3420949 RepID=UPI003D10F67F